MASQVAAGQHSAQVTATEERPVAPGVTARPDQTLLDQPQLGAQFTAPSTTADAGIAQSVRASEAADFTPFTIMVASAAAVGAATLFTTGFLYRRSMPALRRLAVGVLEIRIPVLFPVAVVAITREILAYRRAVSEANAASRPAR